MLGDLFNKNKNKLSREMRKFVGHNTWVKSELFKNSPLSKMGGYSLSISGVCWVRFLVYDNGYFICNICKDETQNNQYRMEVTKEEIKKILTTKCRINENSIDIIEPVEACLTEELFLVTDHPNNFHAEEDHDDDDQLHDAEDWDEEEEDWDEDEDWPTNWDRYEDYDADEMWERFFREPELRVNNELQVFMEPSTQGNMGSMFICDESGENRFAPIEVDYMEWCDEEFDMARESNSAEEYEDRYREYVQDLIDNAEPYED